VLVKLKKKLKVVKRHLKDDSGSEDVSADGSAAIEEHEHQSDFEDSSANGNEKKSHGNKNASEDDTGSKEDKSDAAQEELKDHDKLYFFSASEDLNANIATANKISLHVTNTRTIDNTSTFKSRNAISSKHITPILSTNYLLTKESVTSLSLFTLSLFYMKLMNA
jgi:cobalamin biosynthesis protein CobT